MNPGVTPEDLAFAHLLMGGPSGMTPSTIHTSLADLESEELIRKLHPEYRALLRRMLLRRLASIQRGRRGLIVVPEEEVY